MKIDDLPEDEFISLRDADGTFVECRILGRTTYEDDEYIICSSVSGEYAYMVIDARAMEGQMIPVSEMTVEEIVDKFLEEHPELRQDEVIALTDDDGNEVRFAVLDFIEEQGKCYVVCIEEEDEEADEVIIMEVCEIEDQNDMEEYLSIEDETLLAHLFEVFKDRNADYFNFT